MKKKVRFKAHETFLLRDGWLYKLTQALKSGDNDLFRETKAVDTLGVGYNMTKSIKYWAKTMGLIEERKKEPKGTYLTELAEVIVDNDPYFESYFTLWILHIFFVSNYEEATAWNMFFNKFNAKEFTYEEMVTTMCEYVDLEGVKVATKSIEADCKMIIKMYSKSSDDGLTPEDLSTSMFAKLNLFSKRGDKIIRKHPNMITLDKMVLLFIIVQLSENTHFVCNIDQLESSDNGIGKLLGIDRSMINVYLDELSNAGYINVVRTAGLDQVEVIDNAVKTPLSVVKEYYKQ